MNDWDREDLFVIENGGYELAYAVGRECKNENTYSFSCFGMISVCLECIS